MTTATIEMGWLDRITNVHFGGNFLLVIGTGTVSDRHGTPLSPPSVTFTPKGQPQDFVLFKQLDQSADPQSHSTPDQHVPVTIFTIWNPAVPLPDSSNIDNTIINGSVSFVGQFMSTHPNIVQDLLLFETPPIFVNPDGTFNSLSDAQAAIKYMPKTLFNSWFNAQGVAVDAGYIFNFAATINATREVPGSAGASNIAKRLYSIPAQGSLQVNVSSPGPNPTSSALARLYVNANLKTIADADKAQATSTSSKNVAGSRDYVVKFATGKNPTVTVS